MTEQPIVRHQNHNGSGLVVELREPKLSGIILLNESVYCSGWGTAQHMPAALSRSEDSANRVCVLVADPDDEARRIYRVALRERGYEVLEASDGRDALVKALVHLPALVITELRLPLIDGIVLCGILHRDRTTARVPVLVVTSERDAATWDQARRAGAKALLGKPAAPETLRGEVERLLTESETAAGTSLPRDAAGGNRAARARESVRRWQRFPKVRPVKVESARAVSLSPPPALRCPSCAQPLVHERGYLGGVGRYPEQWDHYRCPACRRRFEYRHRTRKLRHLA